MKQQTKQKQEKKPTEIERLRNAMLKLVEANIAAALTQSKTIDRVKELETEVAVRRSIGNMQNDSIAEAHSRITRLERLLKFKYEWHPDRPGSDHDYSISLGWGVKRKIVNGEVK